MGKPATRWRYALPLAVALAIIAAGSSQAEDPRESVSADITSLRPQADSVDWDDMLKHRAEFLRLKAKFEPQRRIPGIDLDACERDEMLPPGLRPPQILMELRGCPSWP